MIPKYKGHYVTSQLTISNYEIFSRFKNYNNGKSLQGLIKPFNFVTVGTGYRSDKDKPIIPLLPYQGKKIKQAPYMPFIDYKTYLQYPNKGSKSMEYYWKPLSEVFYDYLNHQESKFDGDIGKLKRKHIRVSKRSIQYIGKESINLDITEILGVEDEEYTTYSKFTKDISNYKEKILNLRPKDIKSFGITRSRLSYIKKSLKRGNRLKSKTIMKLLDYFE